MRKRILCMICSVCMVLSTLANSGLTVSAAPQQKASEGYAYEPQTELTVAYDLSDPSAGTRKVTFFDEAETLLAEDENSANFLLDKSFGNQWLWLDQNGYLLNDLFAVSGTPINYQYPSGTKLGTEVYSTKKGRLSVTYGAASGLSRLVKTSNGWQEVEPEKEFSSNSGTEDRDTIYNGNALNLLSKGDLSLSYSMKARGGSQSGNNYVFVTTSYQCYAAFNMFGNEKQIDGESYADWHYYGRSKSTGSMTFTGTGWSPLNEAGFMSFYGQSNADRVCPVDFVDITVYGKDTQGPKISYLGIYDQNPVYQEGDADIPADKEAGFMNWELEPKTGVNTEMIGQDLYIALVFDEPVVFDGAWTNDEEKDEFFENLSLDIQTMGLSNSTAQPASAKFYSFAPSENTALPAMIFKYTVQDPEVNPARGEYFEFYKAAFNTSDNADLFNYITDLSGNKMAVGASGIQQSFEKNLNKKTVVDMRPLEITDITVTAEDIKEGSQYVGIYSYINVEVNLSKQIANAWELGWASPELTLNVVDNYGRPVTLGGSNASSSNYSVITTSATGNSAKRTTLKYRVIAQPSWEMETPGEFIKVKTLETQEGYGIRDLAGNELSGKVIEDGKMNGKQLSYNNEYRLDFSEPEVTIGDISWVSGSAYEESEAVVRIPIDISDNYSLAGCDGTVSFYSGSGYQGDGMQYLVSEEETVADSDNWQTADGGSGSDTMIFEDSASVRRYLYVKLPSVRELATLTVYVTAKDNKGYTSRNNNKSFTINADTIAPTMDGTWIDDQTLEIRAYDLSDVAYSYEWKVTKTVSGQTPVENKVTGSGSGKFAEIVNPAIGTEQAVYESTVDVTVTAAGKSVTKTFTAICDKTQASVSLSSDTPTDQFISGAPTVKVSFTDIAKLEYRWMAKPYNGDEAYTSGVIPGGYPLGDDQYYTVYDLTSIEGAIEGQDLFTGDVVISSKDAMFTLWHNQQYQYSLEEMNRPGGLVVRITDSQGNQSYDSITFQFMNNFTDHAFKVTSSSIVPTNIEVYNVDIKGLDFTNAEGGSDFSYYGFLAERDLYMSTAVYLGKAYGGREIDFTKSRMEVRNEAGELLYSDAISREDLVPAKEWIDNDSYNSYLTNSNVCDCYTLSKVIPASAFKDITNGEEPLYVRVIMEPAQSAAAVSGETPKTLEPIYQEDYVFVSNELEISGGLAGVMLTEWLGDGVDIYDQRQTVTRNFDMPGKQANLVWENGQIVDKTTDVPILSMTMTEPDSGIMEMSLDSETEPELTVNSSQTKLMLYANDGTVNVEDLDYGGYAYRDARFLLCEADGLIYDELTGEISIDYIDSGIGMDNDYEYWAQWEAGEGTFYENSLIGMDYDIQLTAGTHELYYQFMSNTWNLSPVYKIIIEVVEPEIIIAPSIEKPADGSFVRDAIETSVQITGTEDLAKIEAFAKYDNGTDAVAIDTESFETTGYGVWNFETNGTLTVTVTDKEGKTKTETYVIDYISTAPEVTDLKSESTTQIKVTGKVESHAVKLQFRFDDAYMAWIGADEGENPTWYNLGEEYTFPGMLEDTVWNTDGTFCISGVAKSPEEENGVNPTAIYVRGFDRFGDSKEATIPLQVTGAPAAADPAEYSFGSALNFNVPVKLYSHESDQGTEKFAVTFRDLPIYESGKVTIRYQDMFGRDCEQEITADMDARYEHNITYSHTIDTKENVTATIAAQAENLYIKADAMAGTESVVISGQTYYRTGSLIYTQNGAKAYTLAVLNEAHTQVLSEMTLNCYVRNIDREAPIPVVDRNVLGREELTSSNGEELITTVYGQVAYQITSFDDENVTFLDGSNGKYVFSVPDTYTFRFVDEAGNEGSYTVDESATVFRAENQEIADYLVTFYQGGELIGTYQSSDLDKVSLPTSSKAVTVHLQALNEKGEYIQAVMSAPADTENITYIKEQCSIIFADNAAATVKLQAANEMEVTITVDCIDVTPPMAELTYEKQSNGDVKVYVDHDSDSKILMAGVESDEKGEYFLFTKNGELEIILEDAAGNRATLTAIVSVVDKEVPVIEDKKWLTNSGNIYELTKGAVRLYIEFDEMIGKVVKAEENAPYKVNMLGNTVTVDFDDNCQAVFEVYDTYGNHVSYTFPEDGPLTCIDRTAPEILTTDKVYNAQTNKVEIKFTFSEEVASANEKITDSLGNVVFAASYAKTVEENDDYQFTFSDRVGNVVSTTVNVTEIDVTAPTLTFRFRELDGSEMDMQGKKQDNNNYAAVVRKDDFLLQVTTDEAATKVVVIKENSILKEQTLQIAQANGYADYRISGNGSYQMIATDRYGNTGVSRITIGFLDKEGPVVTVPTKPAMVQAGADAEYAKTILMEGVAVQDYFMGEYSSDNCTLEVDLDESQLASKGTYIVTLTATDAVGNQTKKTRRLNVISADDMYFAVNGKMVNAGGVATIETGAGGTVTIELPEKLKDASFTGGKTTMYWSSGYMTKAQMKNGQLFSESFAANQAGYYTVLVQTADRDAYLLYIYVK